MTATLTIDTAKPKEGSTNRTRGVYQIAKGDIISDLFHSQYLGKTTVDVPASPVESKLPFEHNDDKTIMKIASLYAQRVDSVVS